MYRSLWVTPYNGNGSIPYLHISASYGYGQTCTLQDPVQTLTDFGGITIGTRYRIKITINSSHTIIFAKSRDSPYKSGTYTFPRRNHTMNHHIGQSAGVWIMSGKFGSSQYNRGHGTLSNITIISSDFVAGTTPKPSQPPTSPSTIPSPSPTTLPAPTTNPAANEGNEQSAEDIDSGSDSLSQLSTTKAVIIALSQRDHGMFSTTLWMLAIGGPIVGLIGCVIMCCFMRYQMDQIRVETAKMTEFVRNHGSPHFGAPTDHLAVCYVV